MKKTFFKFWAVIICALFLAGGRARAVEISLDKTGSSGGNTQSLNIGFVDIEKIFNEHPMTSRLKTEFEDKVKEYELILKNKSSEVISFENVVFSSKTAVTALENEIASYKLRASATAADYTQTQSTSAAAVEISTASTVTFAADSAIIASKEKQLEDSKKEIGDMEKTLEELKVQVAALREQNKKDLKKLEEKQTAMVLADIYYLLDKISREENVTLVVDKNYILYGSTGQDLTDKVLERLQGR